MQDGIWILFVLINIGMAWLHNHLRVNAIKLGLTKAIDHSFWSVVVCILCAPVIYVSPWLCVSVLLLHACAFPYFYNYFSMGVKGVYNISTTTSSKIDQMYRRIGLTSMRWPFFTFYFLSVCLLHRALLLKLFHMLIK